MVPSVAKPCAAQAPRRRYYRMTALRYKVIDDYGA
jgi:hypothetical protein